MEVDPDQAAEVVRVFELVRGGQSVRRAAETMTAETGRTWRPTTVDRIVRREASKATTPGQIIDVRVCKATHAAMAGRRRPPGRPTARAS